MQRETVGRPMEILLIEDSLMAARLTIGALKKSQLEHHLTWLNDGEKAWQFLTHQAPYAQAPKPDLILLDLLLPGIDGRGLLARLRDDGELESIPVVIVTGAAEEKSRIEQEQLRVSGVVTKPVNIEEFLSLVLRLKDIWREDMILPPV